MNTRTELITELEYAQDMMKIFVDRSLKRFIVRWTLAIPFYSYFWYLEWMRWMFWFSIPFAIFALVSITYFYIKFRKRIKAVELELKTKPFIS